MRDSLAKLLAVGVPARASWASCWPSRRAGARAVAKGWSPPGAWFEVAKLQALAARQIARELRLGYVVSWGWGFFNEQARDPDKLGAACVWLWARERSLCAAEALPERFDRDLRAGQIDLPAASAARSAPPRSRRTRSRRSRA